MLEIKKTLRCAAWLVLMTLCAGLAQGQTGAPLTGIDTTRVRKTTKVKKSAGAVIADIPGEIIKFPFYTLEFINGLIVTNPPVSELNRIVPFLQRTGRYIPIAGYDSQAGLKFGLRLGAYLGSGRNQRLKGRWYYSTNDYRSFHLNANLERFLFDGMGLDGYFRYDYKTRERFFGIGMGTGQDTEANYTIENTEFGFDMPIQAHRLVTFHVIGGYQIANLSDGEDSGYDGNLDSIAADPDYAMEEGRLDGSRYGTLGAGFEFDSRDSRARPSRGTHLYLNFSRSFGVNRSAAENFNRYSLDIRQYLNVWQKRIFAFRFFVQRFDADDGNQRATPVYLTSRLGGSDALRGYKEGRYVDNDMALFSVEYRYPIWDIIDAFWFVDQGRVFNKVTEEEFFKDWKLTGGFGLRVWSAEDVTAMIQIARSDETTQFYFSLGAQW